MFILRTENEISHALAHFAVKVVHNIEWEQDFPIWLIDLVKREMRVVSLFLYLILVRSSVYIYIKDVIVCWKKKGIQQRDWVTSSLVEPVSINLIFINIK